jgi:hypothetical protein
MLFEARELKSYTEPISTETLKVGDTFFAENFLDEEMLLPVMEPRVFIGRDLVPGDDRKFYFQDYDSYQDGIRFETATKDTDAIFETGAEHHMFEYERALDVLMNCALRRRKSASKNASDA